MGGKRCGWVERGWTYTENKMRQIDTSRYFWRADFGTKNKNHYMVVWRQSMARQICLHEKNAKYTFAFCVWQHESNSHFSYRLQLPNFHSTRVFISIITSRVRWSSKHFGFHQVKQRIPSGFPCHHGHLAKCEVSCPGCSNVRGGISVVYK